MIFQPKLAHLILEGRKTMTRRPVNGDEDKSRYAVGRTYALERPRRLEDLSDLDQERVKRKKVSLQRFRETVGRILITDVRREELGAITLEDAIAEGFRTRAAFADYWMRLHDPAWPVMTKVDCPHCDEEHVVERWCARCNGSGKLSAPEMLTGPASVDRPCPTCAATGRVWVECPDCDLGVATVEAAASDEEILGRFNARHARRYVWVLTFVLESEVRPRFLSVGLGYTGSVANALPGEPPAVDAWTQQRITERAGMTSGQWLAHEQARRDSELEEMSLGQRFDALIAEANAAGVSVSSDLRLIEKRLNAVRAKLRERLVA